MSFLSYAIQVSPPWMRGRMGAAWTEAKAIVFEVLADATREAIKARFPLIAPEDALPYLSSERGLEKMPAESVATWRERIWSAWDTWIWAGTKNGVQDAIDLADLFPTTSRSIKEWWDWPNLPSAEWARFWLLVEQPHAYTAPPNVGDPGLLVDGSWVVGISGMTIQQVQLLRRTIRTWKPAHTRCPAAIIVLSGEIVGGSWTVGDGTIVGGTAANIPI